MERTFTPVIFIQIQTERKNRYVVIFGYVLTLKDCKGIENVDYTQHERHKIYMYNILSKPYISKTFGEVKNTVFIP